jgi:hypothetical protein
MYFYFTMSNLDVFGIKKIYKDDLNGPQWNALHWAKGGSRTVISGSKDPYDPTKCSENRGNVTWTIDGQGNLIFNGTRSGTTEPRFHLNNPSAYFFENVECTFYYKRITDTNVNWGGAIIGVRSGPNGHSISSEYCDAHTYYQRFRHDGNIDFEKELKHPDSSVKGTLNIWNGGRLPFNKWIGYKSITRNAGTTSVGVRLELYIDLTEGLNGGTWTKLGEVRDTGGWAPPQAGTPCSYPADYIPIPGGGVIVLRNTGVTNCQYKWMTVRAITSSMFRNAPRNAPRDLIEFDSNVNDECVPSSCTTEEVLYNNNDGCITCENGQCNNDDDNEEDEEEVDNDDNDEDEEVDNDDNDEDEEVDNEEDEDDDEEDEDDDEEDEEVDEDDENENNDSYCNLL